VETVDDYLVDVVVPFADRLENLYPLKSWLSKESLPANFRVILVHDIQNQDTAGRELQKLLSILDSKSYIYIRGKFGSPGGARNAGLDKVTARWVCFWDSDDYPQPQEFLKMIEFGIRDNSQVCVGKFEITQLITKHQQKKYSQGNSLVSVATTPGFWRMAFTRDSIGEVRFLNSRMGEDQLFLMAINFGSLRWYRHNEVVYRYIIGVGSQLTSLQSSYSDLLETFENSVQFCDRDTNFRAAYIYSIMQIRMAMTIYLKFPIKKSRNTLMQYAKKSISSPKNLFLATIPALLTVFFNYILTILRIGILKFRGCSAKL
jgi:glycosyltransferase involved in cell wall biosynthesis